ncbi:MAG TPA: adenosylcobalamin-dependent ribonucleoside-diphosphate reductase [Acidimicrobiales bacterium]|nr:adenosylcobalamin-dependent ribonucleoside-diphosphate reductase [Acidimicrobiales bacterium]
MSLQVGDQIDEALTDSGRYLLRFRYLAPTPDGDFESPASMFRRVARNLAEAERRFDPGLSNSAVAAWASRFYGAMTSFRYLPNAPTLLGAGRPLQQLFACFVLPVGDSVDEVFAALRAAAVVHARGGGTGFSFSALRPRGSPIASGGRANGPVPFLSVFDAETEVLKAGGTGWGANMGVLRCDHPDVVEFVRAKAGGRALRNFNLSVGCTDAFMDCVGRNEDWVLRHPSTGDGVGWVPARRLLADLCQEAWRTGDPGVLFLTAINRHNPTPALGTIEATNPCGEAPLLPYEACCLGGLNVAAFAHGREGVRWAELEETAALALRMMDNVIEVSRYPLPEIEASTRRTRKVGIGVMGFADLLLRLGIPYDSDDAVTLARALMRRISDATRAMSEQLGLERGSFPAFGQSTWATGRPALRNATTTSNAPNSTIGTIAGCSPGIEPLFAVGYERQLANGARLRELHPAFVAAMEERGAGSEDVFDRVRAGGSVQDVPGVPPELRRLFVTAHDIEPAWHVRVQAAFQSSTDLGVSKTVNLRNDATPADVEELVLLAHRLGCKGITVYRDGCQATQFLVAGSAASAGVAPAGSAETPCPSCR